MLNLHVPQTDGLTGDLGDGAVGESLALDSARENGRLAERLETIAEVLERIREGAYGVCASCNGNIPKTRLEALPCTLHCVQCANAAEAGA